jgi:hypothetical protein
MYFVGRAQPPPRPASRLFPRARARTGANCQDWSTSVEYLVGGLCAYYDLQNLTAYLSARIHKKHGQEGAFLPGSLASVSR